MLADLRQDGLRVGNALKQGREEDGARLGVHARRGVPVLLPEDRAQENGRDDAGEEPSPAVGHVSPVVQLHLGDDVARSGEIGGPEVRVLDRGPEDVLPAAQVLELDVVVQRELVHAVLEGVVLDRLAVLYTVSNHVYGECGHADVGRAARRPGYGLKVSLQDIIVRCELWYFREYGSQSHRMCWY